MLFTSTPYTHGLPCSRCSTTNEGPRPQFLLPNSALLFVGSCRTGPTPHIQCPGLAGDRNAVKTTSPIPFLLSIPFPSDGFHITGRIVRVMMFHSLLIEIGITGWMFRM